MNKTERYGYKSVGLKEATKKALEEMKIKGNYTYDELIKKILAQYSHDNIVKEIVEKINDVNEGGNKNGNG